ncbi:hypothetical protein AIOL_001150 [Candidatus Rhodobacter oscarellae]|uniref:Uncharacterized protein n=1 Tax=Candidatus Rhodobacter oscarellae TaxID=1675527 RepID=A0A0J9GRU3_9RHOB|nr:hypothetical protein [Candidatus Rhodobacter lobularis]KMW56198.1 hypothetical protein AIOL_001150 [Candidatus Rhodobacter lobularis]
MNRLKSKLMGATLAALMPFAASAGTDIKFAGALEFSDDGVLFVGDNHAGAIVALDLTSAVAPEAVKPVFIGDIDKQIADAVGVGPNAVEINDMAVHPVTREIYISVTRISAHGSRAVLVRVTQAGEIALVDLTQTASTTQPLQHFPEEETKFRPRGIMGQPPMARDLAKGDIPLSSMAIMDMEYHNGELFVSGVAYDSFLSTLRRMSYPFDGAQSTASVEMYHIAHDQYETRAPVRAMSVEMIDGKEQLVAAYTCSPIVLIPLEDIQDGEKIAARTIADYGNGQPLDMVSYSLFGQDALFLTSNSRSPQVIPMTALQDAKVVTDADFERGGKFDLSPEMPFGPVGKAVMFDGMSMHIDQLSEQLFVSITRDMYTGSLNLDSNASMFPNRLHNLTAEFDFPQYHAEKDG